MCYVLQSTVRGHEDKTYVGKTNNLKRRLLQHNGVLKGGAKYTTSYRPWRVVFVVGGFSSEAEALRFEWAMKHRRKGKGGGLRGRCRTVCHLFNQTRVTARARPLTETPTVTMLCALPRARFERLARIHPHDANKNRAHCRALVKRARFSYKKFPRPGAISRAAAAKLYPWYAATKK